MEKKRFNIEEIRFPLRRVEAEALFAGLLRPARIFEETFDTVTTQKVRL